MAIPLSYSQSQLAIDKLNTSHIIRADMRMLIKDYLQREGLMARHYNQQGVRVGDNVFASYIKITVFLRSFHLHC